MICKKIKETTKMILEQEYNNKRQYERCFEKLDKLFADSRDNKFYVRVPPVQSGEEPDIYNKYGEKLRVCYMANSYLQPNSRFLYFDYLNCWLDVHFYEGIEMKRLVGNPKIRFGYIGESQLIDKAAYEFAYNNKEILSEELDYIFSFDEKILNEYENARFFPLPASPWYGKALFDPINDNLLDRKKKNVSIISSNKCETMLHKMRVKTAMKCRNEGLADAYGWFDGGIYLENYDDVFTDYRYSIVIENNVSDYYFTEKLTSCFAAQTVPIYVGARKIAEFFNTDGMIVISDDELDNIGEILKNCNSYDYEQRRHAILDNYERVKKYNNMWDWWYREYGQLINDC